MTDGARRLPGDPDELYELLMRGAGTVWQVEAAVRLSFEALELRRWLIGNGYVRWFDGPGGPYLGVAFDEAVDRVHELSRDGRLFAGSGPGKSERAVLTVAASLSGQTDVGTLRHFMPDLDAEHARLVAEAMMYAAGWMDGAADPFANEVDGPGTGPNAVAHDARI